IILKKCNICLVSNLPALVVMSSEELLSVDYEVFGRVQGVFFRKYTQSEGKWLGLVGWVQNTDAGTVRGQLQGPASKVQQMQSSVTNHQSRVQERARRRQPRL
uniref:Acylphosphatase n=1 Tax=Cyprinus carpio TaxID=7962 RepID=A0A8C1ZCF8_CYPCA